MQLLNFAVNKQIIEYSGSRQCVIAESRGHVYAAFVLDDDWAGLNVTATFENEFAQKAYSLQLGSDPVAIPPEALIAGSLRVSLEGLGNSGELRLTTKRMDTPVRIYRAGALIGISPEYATPELWEQALASIGNLSNLDTNDKSSLVAAINEAMRNGGNVEIEVSAQNVVNVKEYGATGDGVTDDTAAIAAAVADIAAGETLYFPEGVYRVSAVELKSNMTVLGSGWCSVIKLIDNAPDDYTNCLDLEGVENVIIRDIKLDGSRWTDGGYTQASTGDSKDFRLNGIRIRASSNIRIENVWMHNNGYHGCVMTKSRNVVIDRCRVTDNGFRPIHGNTQVFNCQITNSVCENNGLGLQGGSGALNDSIFFFGVRDLVIANNIIKSNRRGCITVGTDQAGMADEDLTESGNITITGNVCECYEDLPYVSEAESDTGVAKDASMGIAVYGSSQYKLESVTVTGNTILRANRAFYIYSQEKGTLATINAAITGNTVKDCSYGIYAQDVSGVVCSGNQFRGLAVNWIYGNAIEDCQFSGNLVYAMDINQVCRMYNSKNVVLQSNDIIGNKAYAIYLPASNTGCIVMSNTMQGFTLDNPVLNPNGHTTNNVPGATGGAADAVQYVEQELTAEQQTQARENIGAQPSDCVVTFSQVDGEWTADKTFAEVMEAYNAGHTIKGRDDFYFYDLYSTGGGEGFGFIDRGRTELKYRLLWLWEGDSVSERYDTVYVYHPVTSVNGKTGTVKLTAADVGALPDTTEIPVVPTNVSAFTNDVGYAKTADTYTKAEIDAIMGSYITDIDTLLGGEA